MAYLLVQLGLLTACYLPRPPGNIPAVQVKADQPFLPVRPKPPLGKNYAYPAAFAQGNLVLEGRCLKVVYSENLEVSHLIIWPPDTQLIVSDPNTYTLVTRGTVIRIGDAIAMGGGEYHSSADLANLNLTVEPIPTECPGPIWLASDVKVQSPP